MNILVKIYLFFSRRTLYLWLNCNRNKSVLGFFENIFSSYKNSMDYAIKLCRKACKWSGFHFAVRLIRRRTCSKTVIIFFNINLMKILWSSLLLVYADGQNWRYFTVAFFQFLCPTPPPKKKLSRDKVHADVGW